MAALSAVVDVRIAIALSGVPVLVAWFMPGGLVRITGGPRPSGRDLTDVWNATLAPNHPPIVKVEFYYGYPCDPSAPCPIGSGDVGYVLVQMAAPDSDEWIGVVRHPDGSLTAGPAAATTPSP